MAVSITQEPFAIRLGWERVLQRDRWRLHSFEPWGLSGIRCNMDLPFAGRFVYGTMVVTQATYEGQEILHASVSAQDRMPLYDHLTTLHRAVYGKRPAYQVFVPPDEHVNDHPWCLHLWGRADGRPMLPNFRMFGSI